MIRSVPAWDARSLRKELFLLHIGMKRITKKLKAKREFVQTCLKLHYATIESDFVKSQLKLIKDDELNELVDEYVEAWKALEEKIQKMDQEVAALLPDNSDF